MAFVKGTKVFIQDALYVAVSDTPITIVLSSVEGLNTNQSPFQITIVFDEPVTGFDVSDFLVTNGSAGNLSGSGDTYTADITPSAEGNVTIQVIGAGISDADIDIGRTVNDSDVLTVVYDTDAPEPFISSSASDPTTNSPIPLDIVFTEQLSGADDAVTGLTAADFTVVNGTAQNLVQIDGHTYTLEIVPGSPPVTVQVTLPAGTCLDLAGNSNVVSNTFAITYQSA